MLKPVLTLAAAIAFIIVPLHAPAAPSSGKDIVVQVEKDGSAYVVTAELTVAATLDETWQVLVDFDKMAQILSNVDASKVVKADGNKLEVTQKSHGQAGPLRISLDSTRQIELTPKREIQSHLIKGDLKSSDFTTTVSEAGSVTKISVRGKFVAGGLAASALTPEAVEGGTRRQYQELRDEILRRKSNEPTPPCLLAKNCAPGPG